MSLLPPEAEENFKDRLDTKLTFGKWKDYTIAEVVTMDMDYIIYLYDEKIINPNTELLSVIHAHKVNNEVTEDSMEDGLNFWDTIFRD